MSAPLIDNFALLAASEGGVAKLRELILSLAVRGKLVPQDPADEPASELLKRIRAEKERLVAEGKIKREKTLPAIGEEDQPFELPDTWEWVQFAAIGEIVGGGTPKSDNPEYWAENGIPWLTPADLYGLKAKGISRGRRDISEKGLANSSAQLLPAGSVLFSSRAPIGYVAIANNPLATNQGFKSCVPTIPELAEYIYWFLKSAAKEIDASASGTTFKEVSGADVSRILIPLPPLPEQSRIVAKIEALMALCDRLEAQQGDAARVQAHWTQAALDQLAESGDADEFARNWQALAEHFDTLFDTPASIDALDATLLQLAVRGKLVPQNPDDEPASELLKKIRAEKDRLIAAGQIKRDKPLPPIAADEIPYQLPFGWSWSRLGDLIAAMGSGWSPACPEGPTASNNEWGVLKTTAVQVMEYRAFEHKKLPSNLKARPEIEVQAGDILITRAGPKNRVGISCVAETTRPKLMISDKIVRFHLASPSLHPSFIVLSLNAGWTKEKLEEAKTGMAESQVNISQSDLREIPLPICPPDEQSRIVAKLNELLTLTRTLRARLADARAVQARLASALVEEVAA